MFCWYYWSVSIVTRLENRGSLPVRDRELFCAPSLQTGSGAHPDSYPIDIGGSFPRDKAAGA